MNYVTITHPDLGEAQVVPSALPVWLDRGWSEKPSEDTQSTTAPSATPSAPVQTAAAARQGDSTAPAESGQN